MLHLVRHGRPLVDPGTPAAQWDLDPAAYDDVWAPAVDGWEPLTACRDRVTRAVRRVLDVHGGDDVVLVGHGTAWTVVVADLTGRQPDLERWAALAMPDLISLDV